MARVIETTTDPAWANQITALAQSLVSAERCNASAVAAGRLELTFPDLATVQAFLARPDALVVICHDGPTLEGYLIVVDDRGGKLGGGQGRWVGLTGVPAAQRAGVYRGMLELAVAAYGWVWGRITNTTVRTFLANNITEGAIALEDPEIITYKRPG